MKTSKWALLVYIAIILFGGTRGHAERRVAKAKSGLPEGDAAGKALVPGAGVVLYPFETSVSVVFVAVDDAAPLRLGPASFRSRAPPVLAA